MSLPEILLWDELRRRPDGFKFRRQHPLGPYVADFYCAALKLVVEVDGSSHDCGEAQERDARRDAWMRVSGLRVLRFNGEDVFKDMDSVVEAILLEARR
jgi:very-short-patch-repair endonuclease